MSKKEARRKKHEREKRIGSHNILDSEIIGNKEKLPETEETLLGNLARVKHIPMIAWLNIPVTPSFKKIIHIPAKDGQGGFDKLMNDVCNNKKCDLLGFTPLKDFYGNVEYDELGPGSVGIALQIKKVETTATKSLIITTRGICRYENIGFIDTPDDDYFRIKVRWFEDEPEPDSRLIPLYEKHLELIERISKMVGEPMKNFFNVSQTTDYHYDMAHYGSFLMINMFDNWFSMEEQLELFKLTSTSERLRRVNERVEKVLPIVEAREQQRRIGRSN